MDASHTTSLRFGIKRDVLVEDNKTGEDITLTYSMTPYSLAITGATSHWVSLLTKNNSYIHLGSYNATTEWYKPSDEALIEGDRYYISGYWSSNDREQSVSISEVIPVANAGDYTYDLSSVPLLNVTTNSALPLQFNNLNYNDGNADSYRMNFLQIDGYQWDIFICNDWLGDETSYTQPDFSSLANWNSDWNSFKNGDAVSWSASASVFKEATNMQKTRRGTSSIYYGLWIYASSYKSFVL
ncbi:MAG: hypothetical protein K0U38_08745 [Epsilonproteobacteria bacterium]|nr:hypothetical protein [Campylobacterota bacterium]